MELRAAGSFHVAFLLSPLARTVRYRTEDIVVFNNPANLSEPVIDRREVFISRCIGTPGDTLLIDSLFSVIPSEKNAPDQKFLYSYPRQRERQLDSLLSILSIAPNKLLGQDSIKNIRSFSRYEHYLLEQAMNGNSWIQPLSNKEDAEPNPLIVPGKGKFIRVYLWNKTLLRNTLVLHEKKQAEIKNDTLYVDGKPHNTVISPKIIIGWELTTPLT